MLRNLRPARLRVRARQAGLTLIEVLVAMVISLVVAMAMVSLMANTMGTGTRTIQMSRLTAELRAALQIMTRDVRRANYHGNFVACFENVNCRTDGISLEADAATYVKAITVPSSTCFHFWLDRDSDGDIAGDDDEVGAFQLAQTVGGVGVIEMMAEDGGTNPCGDADDSDWVAITNPDSIDVTDFAVDNDLSYTDTIDGGHTMHIDKIRISITAELVADNTVTRTVEDIIRVRNDTFTPAP